jgi:hypothetical protein
MGDFSKSPLVEHADCSRLTLWEKALKFHCDKVVQSCDPKEASALLRDLAMSLHIRSVPLLAKIKSTLQTILLNQPALWWSASTGLRDKTLEHRDASKLLTLKFDGPLPRAPILGWASLHTIIRYYPSHFVVFALQHLDKTIRCPSPYTEEDFLAVAAAASKIALVYLRAPDPLPITSAVLREACRLGSWREALDLLLPPYLAQGESKAHSLIRHTMDSRLEVFEFLLENIPLDHWRSFPELLTTFIRHGPHDQKLLNRSLTRLLQRVNPSLNRDRGGKAKEDHELEPVDRVGALGEACHFALVGTVKVLLKSETYPSPRLSSSELSRVYARAVEAESHECIAFLKDLHPGEEFGPKETEALLYVTRATQVMCYNEDLTSDFSMATHVSIDSLVNRLHVLSASHIPTNSSLILFLCRILSKYLEIYPERPHPSALFPLLTALFQHAELGSFLIPRFRHLMPPSFILDMACGTPFLLRSFGIEAPVHLWKSSTKSLRPLYLCMQSSAGEGEPAPLGRFPEATLDFYKHVRRLADVLGRFDSRRLGCLWRGSPFVTRRCSLETLKTYEIEVYDLDFTAESTELDKVWGCKRGRFLSASSSVDHGKGEGLPSSAGMEVSMLDVETSQTFRLVQYFLGPEDGRTDESLVEDMICGWQGSMPANGNMELRVHGFQPPSVYFVVVRSVASRTLGWTGSSLPVATQRLTSFGSTRRRRPLSP